MVGGGRSAAPVITLLAPVGALRAGAEVRLDRAELHHLKVRRGSDRVRLADGAGTLGWGTLRDGVVSVETTEQVPASPALALLVGAGDKDRFVWLVEKAAELGVTEIQPVDTERSLTVATRLRASQTDRLGRRAREAIKQSGAAWAPVVGPPVPLTQALSQTAGMRWLADPQGSAPPAVLDDAPVTVLIGPEGGLTDAERTAALAAGFQPVRLASLTLRFETAAVAAAACVVAARLRGKHD